MKRFVWLFLIVLVVAGLWSAGWCFAAGQAQQSLARLASNDGQADPRLTCASSSVTGFPFRLDIDCETAELVAEDLTVTASGLRASVQIYNPTHVVFSAHAPITTQDAFYGSSSRLDFTGLQGSARVTTSDVLKGLGGEGWRIARISLVGDGLNWVDTIGAELPLAKASHAELQITDIPELHDATAGTAALAIYATASDVTSELYHLGNANGEVQLQVTGLPDDLQRLSAPDAVQTWQAAGGKVQLMRINGTDGTDLIDASGTLGLDPNRMLEGDITYSSSGLQQRLQPYLDPVVLAVVAGLPQPDGTFKQAIQFSGGSLRIGGIPLYQLAPLY